MNIKRIACLCLLQVILITYTAYAQSDKKEFQTDVLSYNDFINISFCGDYIYAQDSDCMLHILDQSFSEIIDPIYVYNGGHFDENGLMCVINGYAFVTSDTLKRSSFTDCDVWQIGYCDLFLSNGSQANKEAYKNPILPNFSIIDPSGNVVIDNLEPYIYTSISYDWITAYNFYFVPTRFSDYGIAFVKRNDKFGIIDTAGNILYDFTLDSYKNCGENYIGTVGDRQMSDLSSDNFY